MLTETTEAPSRPTEVLIREARRHQRRRYGVIGGLVLLGLVALVVAVVASGIVSISWTPGSASGEAGPGPAAINATRTMRVAAVTLTQRNSVSGCRWEQSTSTGSIDFEQHSLSLTTTSSRAGLPICAAVVGRQTRQFGSVMYTKVTPPYCQPSPCSFNPSLEPPAGRPWAQGSTTAYPGNGDAVQVLSTPFALTAVDALPRATAGHATLLRGESVTEYSARVTLADLQAALHATPVTTRHALADLGSPAGALPPPRAIPISLRVWIDSGGRVVQLSVSEPTYTVNFTSGASEGGYELVPSQYASGDVPSGYPHQAGYTHLTIAFSQFGSTRSPVRPDPDTTFRIHGE